MYIYLLLAFILMVSLKDIFFPGKRNKDRQKNGEGPSSSQQELCEVSTRTQWPRSSLLSFLPPSSHSPLYATRRRFLPRKTRSVGNDPSTSKIRASSTHTAEELVREPTNRSASTRLAAPPESLRSADTVDLGTPGNPSFISIFPSPVTHQPHRDAVHLGHAPSCVECRRQPQAIGDLCLGCNSSIGKSNEPRLRELDLQDPTADSRTFRTSATQPWPLTLFQLSPTSAISGEVPNRSRSEESTRFASRVTQPKPVKPTSAILVPPDPELLN